MIWDHQPSCLCALQTTGSRTDLRQETADSPIDWLTATTGRFQRKRLRQQQVDSLDPGVQSSCEGNGKHESDGGRSDHVSFESVILNVYMPVDSQSETKERNSGFHAG